VLPAGTRAVTRSGGVRRSSQPPGSGAMIRSVSPESWTLVTAAASWAESLPSYGSTLDHRCLARVGCPSSSVNRSFRGAREDVRRLVLDALGKR